MTFAFSIVMLVGIVGLLGASIWRDAKNERTVTRKIAWASIFGLFLLWLGLAIFARPEWVYPFVGMVTVGLILAKTSN